MPTIEDVAERVERLLLRHEEIKRTNALLERLPVDGESAPEWRAP